MTDAQKSTVLTLRSKAYKAILNTPCTFAVLILFLLQYFLSNFIKKLKVKSAKVLSAFHLQSFMYFNR